ncbi:MAG: M20/M25/M40 family metallo-hydrolase [Janthinobacterium lividum]
MDPTQLPFDADRMLADLRPWVECESPTHDAAAVNRMMDLASRDLAIMGATVERIPGRMDCGDCVRASFKHKRSSEPGLLLMGHMDTVHPVGTLAALPWRRDGNRAYGPGIYDMKGGNLLVLEALRQLERAGIEPALPVTVLFTSDEEIGSPSTRDVIEAEAARHAAVLVPEPGGPGHEVTTGRYAIARFAIETTGRPSHAGARLADGRSAIRAMASRIAEIEDMTTEDCTFSVGVIRGGEWVNCVATTCTAQVLSMAKRQADLDRGVERMLALAGQANDVRFDVTPTVTRPVWEPDARTLAVYAQAEALAKQIGIALPHRSAGGGSDGNFTGAAGIPTLDGLGVLGAGGHTLDEHLLVDSLVSRGRLLAGLIATLTP